MYIKTRVYMVEHFEGENEDGEKIEFELDLGQLDEGLGRMEERCIFIDHIEFMHPVEGGTEIYTSHYSCVSYDDINTLLEKIEKSKAILVKFN